MQPTVSTVAKVGGPKASGVRARPWYVLLVLTLVNTLNWADRQVVAILFPSIRADLHLSDQQLGVIGGLAFALIFAVCGFAFGFAADRGMRKHVIALGLVVWSLATAASGLAHSFNQLFWARFFTGAGEASLYPCALSLLSELYPAERRGRALGVFGMAAALGGALGFGLGGTLAQHWGWRQVFLSYGAAGLAVLLLLLSIDETPRAAAARSQEPISVSVRTLLSDRRLLWMWSAGTVALASGQGYGSWVPSYFIRERGLTQAVTGVLFGLATVIGGVGGSALGGILADRAGKRRRGGELDVSVIAGALAGVLIAVTIEGSMQLVYLTGVLTPLCIYAFFPSLQLLMVSLVPAHRRGMVTALNALFFTGIGAASGPFIVGTLSDRIGLHHAVLVPALGFMIASVLAARTRARVRSGSNTIA